MSKKRKSDSKLQGISRLTVDATLELTDLVENMHKRIVHPPFLPSTPVQNLITNIAGVVYKNIRWGTKLMGNGADKALRQFAPYIGDIKSTEQREGLRSVLNGLVGDYLERTDNPLKIDMQFRNEGKAFDLNKASIKEAYPDVNGKILLMLHGSCMNDVQWTHNDHNHGTALATELDKTPVFLNYNSGKHISANGQELNILLEELSSQWPVSLKEITIVAHSMGGLVARSALHYGEQQKNSWSKKLKKIAFLGTPHHGAPLEKAGNYVEVILKAIPYAKPFARLAKIRGAGVTDLRYGNLLDEDWQNIEQHSLGSDNRQHISLPDSVDCYAIAAAKGKPKKSGSIKLQGDSMVFVKSALGKHKKVAKDLQFKEEHTLIVYQCSHVELLSKPEIYTQLKTWMI